MCKGWGGGRFAEFSNFFLKIPCKLFHIHRIFKNGGRGAERGRGEPPLALYYL